MTADYEEIRQRNIEEYGKGTRHLSYFADLYSTRTHFIFELLQNAEDALSRRPSGSPDGYVYFNLFADRLEIRHNGAPFVENDAQRDVSGICGIGETTKAGDYTQIGKHGIGFKSVYAFTFLPSIHSGDEHFEIHRFVEPHGLSPDTSPRLKGGETCIVLPFDNPESEPERAFRGLLPAEQAVREIGDALGNLGARSLLFMQHTAEIRWNLPDGSGGHFLKAAPNVDKDPVPQQCDVEVTDGETFERWKVFSRPATIQDGKHTHDVTVEAAFLVDVDDEKIRRAERTELVVYFPTEKETKLGFLIQAPFKTTKARDNIKTDDPANRQIIDIAAQLAADSLETLRDLGLLDASSYLALPIRAEDFPEDSFFWPVYDKIREALRTRPLLPAHGGDFIHVDEVKLARGAELVELFSPQQLGALYGKDVVRWLDAAITENGPLADLHTYLVGPKHRWVQTRGVEPLAHGLQVEAETLASRLKAEFLAAQDISWLIDFILYASRSQAFRRTPLVRLENGKHVPLPVQEGQTPAYFPTKDASGIDLSIFPLVAHQLTEHEDVRTVFQKEGIHPVNDSDDYYFEAVECVTKTRRRYRENYLALSPHYAALFQYPNHDRDGMRELILSSAGTDIPVRLGNETLVLKFTEKHLDDLKTVLNEDVDADGDGDEGLYP